MGKSRILIENITPERAKAILGSTEHNFRRLDFKRVAAYKNDMLSGRWAVTGDTIKITNGTLIDGQHRLQAVVESGISIKTAVAYDVAESARFVDKGKPRTIAQWLSFKGVKNANSVASVSRLCVQYQRGYWNRQSVNSDEIADEDIINFAIRNQDKIHSSVRLASKTKGLMNISVLGAVYYLGSGEENAQDEPLAVWFSEVLNGRGDVEEGDPPLTLRNRMVKEQEGSQRTPVYIQKWLTTIAWNKAVRGEKITKAGLRIRITGPTRQKPPNAVLVAD